MTLESDTDAQFDMDIRRTILLGKYIQNWGMPRDRVRFFRSPSDQVEVYHFPSNGNVPVARVATIGVSASEKPGTWRCEFMMALPPDLGGTDFKSIASFVMDFVVYVRRPDVALRAGCTVPESKLVPSEWSTRAMLVDEPTGEPEDMVDTHVGPQHVRLWWLIPIHGVEYKLISEHDLDTFYRRYDAADLSLADVRRPPVI